MSEQSAPTLRERIAGEIRRCGPIPFSRYMELCLYEPELGYYSRPREKFGKAGDFYTSSDVHAVFGRLLARQFEEMWRTLDSPSRLDLIELGPGRGLFARDVLDWSAKQFPRVARSLRYSLVERSGALQKRLQERLENISRQLSVRSSARWKKRQPRPARTSSSSVMSFSMRFRSKSLITAVRCEFRLMVEGLLKRLPCRQPRKKNFSTIRRSPRSGRTCRSAVAFTGMDGPHSGRLCSTPWVRDLHRLRLYA